MYPRARDPAPAPRPLKTGADGPTSPQARAAAEDAQRELAVAEKHLATLRDDAARLREKVPGPPHAPRAPHASRPARPGGR